MAIFTLEEAARFSGRSPREVRLLIETGEIPGRRRAGRWMVTSHDLERSLSKRGLPDPEPHPPVGADPDDPFAPPTSADPGRARDSLLAERVRRLERELADVREELAEADARVIDLERAALETGGAGRQAALDPSEGGTSRDPRKDPNERPRSVRRKRAGEASTESAPDPDPDMRQALTPLFRPEGTRPRKGGSPKKPSDRD